MPYVKPERRYAMLTGNLLALGEVTPGDLNYKITQLLIAWLGDKPNYERFNAAIGVLESAKLELYRRAVAPYEDTKIAENGDVY